MTLQDALTIARSTRRQIHDLGYVNADDAIERAAEVLADEVEAYQHMDCTECRFAWLFEESDEPMCVVDGLPNPTLCRSLGGGCKGFQPRLAEQ